MKLAFGFFLGAVTVASLLLTVHDQRKHFRTLVHDHSSHIFSHLTAEEITAELSKPQPQLIVPTGNIKRGV